MKNITIIIPVFNNLEFTRNCVQTLCEFVYNANFKNSVFNTVIVDDGSTDGTGEWLSDHHPEINVLKGDGTLWWSGGVNMGARYAIEKLQADLLLLWNNDIVSAPEYFIEIDKLAGELDNQTIAGSKIFYYGTDNVVWSFGGLFNPKSGVKSMLGYNMRDSRELNRVISVDWLPGMGTLIPVGVIHGIGYWDEKGFPQYHGDSDFTYRAKLAGYRIMVYPQLKLWNDKNNSGLTHENSLKGLMKSLKSIRSNSNIRKNILFYRRYTTSIWAYTFLFGFYLRLIGGFFKWKTLAIFGVKRTQ